jgi:4-hydroxybenzoyl-CoA thioesterase
VSISSTVSTFGAKPREDITNPCYERRVRFHRSFRVRFGDADPAGIAYYPRFFEWFHDAFEALFEAATGRPYAEILGRERVGFPAVQVATEYRSPARFGEEVQLEVFISRLRPRSATFEYRVKREGVLLATASIKIAVMNLDRFESAEFPPSIAAALYAYVEEDAERPDVAPLRG